MTIHNLFPTPVQFFKLDRELKKKEHSFLLNQKQRKNSGNATSVNNYILKEKELFNLKSFLELSLNKYFKEICKPSTDVKPYITQSWVNYCKKGEFHHIHTHPNSFISGIFYVQADVNKDKIYFFKDGYKQLLIPTNDFNLYNSTSWWFEVKTGDLILFPSSLTHKVETVETDLRISLSFNTFLKGTLGVNNDLSELILEK
jgi:uncharacterized protein (TIGR02466 family)